MQQHASDKKVEDQHSLSDSVHVNSRPVLVEFKRSDFYGEEVLAVEDGVSAMRLSRMVLISIVLKGEVHSVRGKVFRNEGVERRGDLLLCCVDHILH